MIFSLIEEAGSMGKRGRERQGEIAEVTGEYELGAIGRELQPIIEEALFIR